MSYVYVVRQQSIEFPNRFERDVLMCAYTYESTARSKADKYMKELIEQGFEKHPAMGPWSLRKIESDGIHETYITIKIQPLELDRSYV